MTLRNIFNVSHLFFVIASVIAFEDVQLMQQQYKGFSRNILCRNCGSDVATSATLISKSSLKSRYSFTDTLFNKDDVLVQVFASDVFFHYPLISFTYSSCVPTGEWEESTSWFPGYLWKPCVCQDCGAFIGFVFEPIDHSLVELPQTFYGLILTSLISEHCKYIQYSRVFGMDLWARFFFLVPLYVLLFRIFKITLLYCVVYSNKGFEMVYMWQGNVKNRDLIKSLGDLIKSRRMSK